MTVVEKVLSLIAANLAPLNEHIAGLERIVADLKEAGR